MSPQRRSFWYWICFTGILMTCYLSLYDNHLLSQTSFIPSLLQLWSPRQIEVELYPCSCQRILHFPEGVNYTDYSEVSSCSNASTARGFGQKVVSYSVFGDFPSEYYEGLSILVTRAKEAYPGWVVRAYLDLSVQDIRHWACKLACENDHLDICDVNNLPDLGNLSYAAGSVWRFMVVGDLLVDKYIVRDTDMPIIQREVDAVQEWLESGKCFHVMRDHPYHGVPMLAGMWGGCNTWQPQIFRDLLLNMTAFGKAFSVDQPALAKYMWPLVKENSLMHDSHTCQYFPNTTYFPTRRENFTFVGMRTYREAFRVDIVTDPCPKECRPPGHQDWENC